MANFNIKLSNILYQWQFSMASFRFCATCLLHIKPFVVNTSAIFPFLGGLWKTVACERVWLVKDCERVWLCERVWRVKDSWLFKRPWVVEKCDLWKSVILRKTITCERPWLMKEYDSFAASTLIAILTFYTHALAARRFTLVIATFRADDGSNWVMRSIHGVLASNHTHTHTHTYTHTTTHTGGQRFISRPRRGMARLSSTSWKIAPIPTREIASGALRSMTPSVITSLSILIVF